MCLVHSFSDFPDRQSSSSGKAIFNKTHPSCCILQITAHFSVQGMNINVKNGEFSGCALSSVSYCNIWKDTTQNFGSKAVAVG